MKLLNHIASTAIGMLALTLSAVSQAPDGTALTQQSAATLHKDVVIPFELVNKNIYLQVTVMHSKPLWFVLDTGVKYACIDLSVAKSLGLELGDQVSAGGGGKDAVLVRMLKSGSFSVVGLDGLTQPVSIAVPFEKLSKASGHEFSGILGFDFISQFVIEIDYQKRAITLHGKDSYEYQGQGEALPITFNAASHPQVLAQVIDGDGPPVEGKFTLDLGSGAGLILNKPFVDARGFLESNRQTIQWIEGLSIGGGIPGLVGRVGGIKVGRYLISDPVTVFTQASSGVFATSDSGGNIGAGILEKFKIILDYGRNRIILEPNDKFAQPIEYNRSGLSIISSGTGYRSFEIDAVAEKSPASEAGLRTGDILNAIDGHPAAEYTLSQLRQLIQDAKVCELTIDRGNKQLKVKLKPRQLI